MTSCFAKFIGDWNVPHDERTFSSIMLLLRIAFCYILPEFLASILYAFLLTAFIVFR